MTKPSRSFWPLAIIAWFIVFISFIASFIAFAVHQREDLVRNDYYDQELRYQEQLDRAARGQAVGREVAIQYEATEHRITIRLPREQALWHPTGKISFYRPSDASLDHETALAPDADGLQRVDASSLKAGLWKVRLYWTVNDQEYYYDQPIVVKSKNS